MTDGATSVRYACPRCRLVHIEPVTDEQATALARCEEVGFEAWTLPTEEPPRADAPAFRVEDVADWMAMLDDDLALLESLTELAREQDADEHKADAHDAEEQDRT
jgi:hypothetical protein